MEVLLCQDKDLLQGQLSLLVPGNGFHHLVILNICKTSTGVPRAWGTAAPWATPAHPEPLSRDMGWVSDCLVWGEEAQPHRQTPQNALIPPPTRSSRILSPFFKETPPILHMENKCSFNHALQGPEFSPWRRQVWICPYKNESQTLPKGWIIFRCL